MMYDKFRVRTPVKSFRDLEVYQQTTKLSAEIFNLKIPVKYKNDKDLMEEIGKLKEMSKQVPRLIVESYGDKFSDLESTSRKMEKSAYIVNMIVAKIDFLNALVDSERLQDELTDILKRYQRVKLRILNLKKAWNRVWGKK
ncbi:hypothetical protein ACFLZC_00870 [Patescibacteria group bacterium]